MAISVVGPVNSKRLSAQVYRYSLRSNSTVLVEGQDDSYVVHYDPKTGRIACNCDQTRHSGRCVHMELLLGGLWGCLAAHCCSEESNPSVLVCDPAGETSALAAASMQAIPDSMIEQDRHFGWEVQGDWHSHHIQDW